MIEATGDLWTYPAAFRVITTNGSVRRDGRAVMGRGCAYEAAHRYPSLPRLLGAHLQAQGNCVHFFEMFGGGLFSFPVKHHWRDDADLTLIAESVADFHRHLLRSATYVLPRPGCGNGRLSWEAVRPLLVGLPDSVTVITFPPAPR